MSDDKVPRAPGVILSFPFGIAPVNLETMLLRQIFFQLKLAFGRREAKGSDFYFYRVGYESKGRAQLPS